MSQENRATPQRGPVAPTFSALKRGVALQVASYKVSQCGGGVAATLSPVTLQWATYALACEAYVIPFAVMLSKNPVRSFVGIIAFLQRACKKLSACKLWSSPHRIPEKSPQSSMYKVPSVMKIITKTLP